MATARTRDTRIGTDAINVVDGLPCHEVSAEKFLGHKEVLEHVTLAGTRMIRYAHHDEARLVPGATAPPVAVGWTHDGSRMDRGVAGGVTSTMSGGGSRNATGSDRADCRLTIC